MLNIAKVSKSSIKVMQGCGKLTDNQCGIRVKLG